LGAAIAGALFGPVIGTVANAVGRKATFSAVMVVSLVLIALAARLRAPAARSGQGMRQLRSALASPTMIAGMWLVALPALVSGVLDVLAPLRLHHLGATSVAIGATFLVAAGVESFISPVAGRLPGRGGR